MGAGVRLARGHRVPDLLVSVGEGWGLVRPGDRKSHYYRETFSLCSRVGFYRGPLEPDDWRSSDQCAACRRALDREAARGPRC